MTTTTDTTALIDRYGHAWTAADAGEREAALAEVWADGATYTDPTVHLAGAPALLAHIARLHASRPGTRVERTGPIDQHHGQARFTWHAVLPDGTVLRRGIDIATLSGDGRRIEGIVGFFDPAPGRLLIDRLRPEDRTRWGELAAAYKRFYRTELPASDYDLAWRRLQEGDGIHAFAARLDGELVGITHYLFHTSVWTGDACYLQDLYVDEHCRSRGVARALIEKVAEASREHGATRLHWLTAQDNARARLLYEKVARHVGFIRYDYPLG